MLQKSARVDLAEIQQLRGISINNSFMKCFILRALKGTADNSVKNIGVDALSWKEIQECWTFIWMEGSLMCFPPSHFTRTGFDLKVKVRNLKKRYCTSDPTHLSQQRLALEAHQLIFQLFPFNNSRTEFFWRYLTKTSILWRPNRGLIEVSFPEMHPFGSSSASSCPHPSRFAPLYTAKLKINPKIYCYSFNTIYIFKAPGKRRNHPTAS